MTSPTARPTAGPRRGAAPARGRAARLRAASGAAAAPALAALVALSASACSGDEPEAPAASSAPTATTSGSAPSSAEPAPPGVSTTRVQVEEVVGRLQGGARGRLVRQVAPVIDGWWEAAYLGGEWPRSSFGRAFPGFTRGATQEARRDVELLSNADIGAEVTGVSATKRDVRLDVVAPSGRIAGVTARIRLDFETTGEQPHAVSVRGRVFLTRKEGRWRIFGYDVRKAVR